MNGQTPINDADDPPFDLNSAIEALQSDFGKVLSPRIRTLEHSVTSSCAGLNLRVHYPSLRGSECTVKELVDVLSFFVMRFALPRKRVRDLWNKQGMIPPDEYDLLQAQLRDEALSLFKKAHKNTNRNGEAGELLLYLLTEWHLRAPQILAKMSLKTNPAMPVHGADGVHVRYSNEKDRLEFFWGESKIYADVGQAILAAAKSISDSLKPEKIGHELFLVERDIDLSGLDEAARAALLVYLNPMEELSNERESSITCLICFNFDAYSELHQADKDKIENNFRNEVASQLQEWSKKLAQALTVSGVNCHSIEIFFFPVPCVSTFRDKFQDKIGWNHSQGLSGVDS